MGLDRSMQREITVRFAFGDARRLAGGLWCAGRHRRLSCLTRELTQTWRYLTGGDPTWQPYTVGAWIEVRRWRAWARREHERAAEPGAWRHSRPAVPGPPRPIGRHRLRERLRVPVPLSLRMYPGIGLTGLGGATAGGVLCYDRHYVLGVALVVAAAATSSVVLWFTGVLVGDED